MAYTQTVWKDYPDTTTKMTAQKLNNIENGIEALDTGKATGVEVVTGTDDTKYVTAKAINDADLKLKSKIITATRVMSAGNGDVSYTGVGFKPSSITAIAAIDGSQSASWGFSDSSGAENAIARNYEGNMYGAEANIANKLIFAETTGYGFVNAVLKSYDTDGFTLTWAKSGTPTATVRIKFICYR